MASLVVRERGRVPYTVELGDRFRIGREPDNELMLRDGQASRHHIRFDVAGAGWSVIDLGSTHGTMVNGVAAREQLLVDGDELQIGNVLLTFRAHGDPPLRDVTGAAPPAGHPDARRLQALYEISRAVGSLDDPDELLGRMLEATIDVLGCERGVLGLLDGASPAGRRIARARDGARGVDDIIVSRTLLEAMVRGRKSVLVEDPHDAPATLVQQGVRTAMGAPLVARSVLGYVYVDDRSRADPFTSADLSFLTALAHLTAVALDQAAQHRRAVDAAAALRDANPIPVMIGTSEPMQRLEAQLRRYARAADAAVLIRGESGTGKELVAATIHALSSRAGEPFVAINCAAMPDSMIESELFGHDKGAFTGAVKARRGKLAMADGGTLFLDEIGDLSLAAQAKLLRALQDGEIQPLGSERAVRVDLRVLSATHKDLESEIEAGRFREDLYFRLAVGVLEVPPLRARGDDVILLAEAFLADSARRLGRDGLALGPGAQAALRRYGWPGNVRQLRNEIERAVILSDGAIVELPELHARATRTPGPARPLTLAERYAGMDVTERELVTQAMAEAGGNVSEAARRLGISRIVLRRRLERMAPAADDDAGEPLIAIGLVAWLGRSRR